MTQQSPVTRLSEAEAWELLRSAPVGRLATVVDRQPDIFPVNFIVEDSAVIFRTAEGSKLLQVTVNSRVAFQADGWVTDTGWSVVAKGTATEMDAGAERDRIESLLHPWVATVKTHVVRIEVDEIEGRRFVFGEEPEPDYAIGD
ncbi:MAG: pyridoxamine 5'-phosphate oxidase family protein [Micropruina sp.]